MTFIENQAQAWTQIAEQFADNETPNGPGSQLDATAVVSQWLPKLLRAYSIRTMLDAPCGDWNWMRHVDLGDDVDYFGWDNEIRFIEENRKNYGQTEKYMAEDDSIRIGWRHFHCVNMLTAPVFPCVDLIMVRDFMIHLPNGYIALLLDKINRSASHYLLATNHPGASNEHACPLDGGHDDRPGYFHRPVNLEAPPFSLTGRLASIPESDTHELVLFDLGWRDMTNVRVP